MTTPFCLSALTMACLWAAASVVTSAQADDVTISNNPAPTTDDGKIQNLPDIVVTASPALMQSLTVPNTAQATATIQRTPGAVEVVPDTAFKAGPAQTIKDVLGWVPGVFAQSRFGDDARVSIRGSGLSRNYGNRGINVSMDGFPVNTSDGLVDLFEIDPTAYRYVEVFKGANAMRYGANSLGGAINYVTPTGRDASRFDGRVDAGSFGYIKAQASTGGVNGAYDYFITGSAQQFDGYRKHSDGDQQRLSANVGYQFLPDAETRFYLNANRIKQRLPGEVTKDAALNNPENADPYFVLVDQQRNIDSVRLANKTTLQLGPTTVDFGVFGVRRHVMHPIYQWLDYTVLDRGGFIRAADDRSVNGFRNQLVAGLNLHNGTIDNKQYQNLPGAVKGELAASNVDKSENVSAYVENSFYIQPDLALIAGTQFLHAERKRTDRFLSNGNQSGNKDFDVWSPKVGVLWDVNPDWQVFANISRSAEIPTFDANSFTSPASANVDAQTATTYEMGTRGKLADLSWEASIYRAQIKKELQCITTSPYSLCSIINADRTVHQGVEAALNMPVLDALMKQGNRLWFNLAYTYNDFFFDGDSTYGNNELPGVPPHFIRVELLYKHPSGFYAGPNTEWVPKAYFADNANQVRVNHYTLLNLKAGYEAPNANWSAYIEGRNLSDKRYIANAAIAGTADATAALFNPGTGRAVYSGIRFKW